VPPGTFISVGRSLDSALDRVRRADQLGYEAVYTTHVAGLDSLTLLAAYAGASDRIAVGTGVMPIYSRSPVATAQQAVAVDQISGGRLRLGLGVSHKITVENSFGSEIGKPVREMREYVAVLRAIFAGEEPPRDNERFRTQFRLVGPQPRADLPIYLGALSPAMLRLAGEIAEGVVLWLCNPNYIRDVVVPEVRAGRELVTYFSLPFYRKMLERSGFGDDIERFDARMAEGDAPGATAEISDRFLELLAAIGTQSEARASVRRYLDAGATSPCIGGISGTDFDATLEALAPS
jgi:alkanesulfonate monooxygenase SsuD/methylene tetrahydromethanopterin reductase-like flavin-dependent oxidoreductase (luciferase family)